jgi:hypothetical protein
MCYVTGNVYGSFEFDFYNRNMSGAAYHQEMLTPHEHLNSLTLSDSCCFRHTLYILYKDYDLGYIESKELTLRTKRGKECPGTSLNLKNMSFIAHQSPILFSFSKFFVCWYLCYFISYIHLVVTSQTCITAHDIQFLKCAICSACDRRLVFQNVR